jgi:hypothetical protein
MKISNYITLILLFSLNTIVKSQTPTDFIYMPKKVYCLAATYNQNSWNEYWENDFKRENLNLGTVTTQQIGLMIAGGITDKLNIMVALPYVSTKTTAGNLLGQKGIQDLSGWLKYRVYKKEGFNVDGVIGGSIPVTNYVPDFMPLSLGLQCKTASARLIATYQHKSGMYITANAAYILRSTITIDRETYYANDKINNTNIVSVPNATNAKVGLGYYKNGIVGELYFEKFGCINGDNIRRNDAPFPTNSMQLSSVGFNGKYQPQNIGVIANFGYAIAGQNAGKSFTFGVGVVFQKSFVKSEIAQN